MSSSPDIPRALESLAVAWPDEVDLVPSVLARLQPATTRPPRLRLAIAAALVVAIAASVLVLSPGTRAAVARLFGFPGVTVERSSAVPSELPGIDLGTEMSLPEAQERVSYPVRTLAAPLQSVWFDAEANAVHQAFELPNGRTALLTQLNDSGDIDFLKRSPDIALVEVNGEFAMWASGRAHTLLLQRPGGVQARLADRALLWFDDGVTLRLEADLRRAEAIRLAETLH